MAEGEGAPTGCMGTRQQRREEPSLSLGCHRRGAVSPRPGSSQPMKYRRREPGTNGNLPDCRGIDTGNIYGDLAKSLLSGAAFPQGQDRCVSRTKIQAVYL